MDISPLVQRIRRRLSTSVHYIKSQNRVLALFVSAGALLASFGALYVSSSQYGVVTRQYEVVERHYRLSVRPHVVITFTLEGGTGEKNGIYIANLGLGPAIVKALSVEVGGKSYDAMDRRVWRNIFRDLTIVPGCFRQGWAQPGNAWKPGDEIGLLTVTHANPPVVNGRSCHIELLKFLKIEGLKVRMQYESMYGESYEAIGESWIDKDTISDISMVMMQQLVPKIVELAVEQVQSMLPQFQQLVDQLQQVHVNVMKHTPALAELMLLRYLYEDPPGAPLGWWLQKGTIPSIRKIEVADNP
jgi:hypothetical protein